MLPEKFNIEEIEIVKNSVIIAEELVSNHYKMSTQQWLRFRYDIKTVCDLLPHEVVNGHYAQVIRYIGQKNGTNLPSLSYDFYKICLQDHSILSITSKPEYSGGLKLFPFTLYIIIHELIHIIRFGHFLQYFDASILEKEIEEKRVHDKTHEILKIINLPGLYNVLKFYEKWL